MTRPGRPTLAVLAVAGVLALAACLVALMASQEAAEATFPGENGRIAFTASPFGAGPWEIYTMLPDGSDRRQITSAPSTEGNAFSPAWSADGTKIAFNDARQGSSEIFTMNADGSGLKQITPTDGIPSNEPAWAPDGTKIAFWSYHLNPNGTNNPDVFVMNADGSGVRRLTTHPDNDVTPNWSPDGSKIAFARQNGARGTSDIWVMDASNGAGQVNLTPNNGGGSGADYGPDWSPDGTKIAFSGNAGKAPNSEIYTVDASGSSRTALTSTPKVAEGNNAWSPDGTQILFGAYEIEGGSSTGIWRMSTDGTNRVNILPDSHAGYADWQPLPMPAVPKLKADCKKGGWREFGFRNQGKCIAFVNRATHSK